MVEITIDHVTPTALGGSDKASNLVTACKDCNSGKTSVPPDAPLVKDVAEDALRWSRAMKVAADAMLAEYAHREADVQRFQDLWHGWRWGTEENPIYAPLPATWRKSVDQILAAGLPAGLLQDCIDTAFSYETVKRENKFKYTCGVAWRKIDKLQETAGAYASSGQLPEAPAEPEGYGSERNALVSEIFALFLEEECKTNELHEEDLAEVEEDDSDPIVRMVEAVLWDLRTDAEFMHHRIFDLLEAIPQGIGHQAMKVARFELYDRNGTDFTKERFLSRSMGLAIEISNVRKASEYLDALPAEERAEWIEYAHALNRAMRGSLVRDYAVDAVITRAAEIAQVLTKREGFWPQMCTAPGVHISHCPQAARYQAALEGPVCCQEDPDGHRHALCERHLGVLVDGERPAIAVRDFEEVAIEEPSPPPF